MIQILAATALLLGAWVLPPDYARVVVLSVAAATFGLCLAWWGFHAVLGLRGVELDELLFDAAFKWGRLRVYPGLRGDPGIEIWLAGETTRWILEVRLWSPPAIRRVLIKESAQ